MRAKNSLTICITVRNERDNIEPVVRSLPHLTRRQEILFVEGHSTDGTWEKIKQIIKKFPDKNIRLLTQPGRGQGDAIRTGFKKARGEIIILYEGDATSDPQDLRRFYHSMRKQKADFIEGNRFAFPEKQKAMPFINKLGNRLFAKWFSFLLQQPLPDVLSGIKAIRKSDFLRLEKNWGKLGIQDPFGDFELLIGAARINLKITSLPMHYYPRNYGKPKTKVLKHGFILMLLALKGYFILRK